MRKQQGVTFIGVVLLAATIVILGVLIMRIVPVYIQNYEVKSSIKALNNVRNEDMTFDAESLKQKLLNQLYINGIDTIKADNVTIVPTDQENHYRVTVNYLVIKPLVYNISLLFKFNESQEVTVDTH
ncbi:transmembrane protein [Legionella beliardensis]|uniref:Transmembrane protein n=1 Tax=Legionella beliardensis TaxID=91822 RepID=A0A378I2D6_9GAMM|nr:DUF4845 domain-containing protein [Legionella beliardensis]STX29357.1 transmembrane protein [Legionella beliardensis]